MLSLTPKCSEVSSWEVGQVVASSSGVKVPLRCPSPKQVTSRRSKKSLVATRLLQEFARRGGGGGACIWAGMFFVCRILCYTILYDAILY